jgi:hypothetical protein
VPTPADLRKQFIKAFGHLAHHRERHEVLADFLEMAFCAIRKKTLPAGAAADALEDRYMAVVNRNTKEDVRAMPELLGITALAMQDGGCDFLGQVVVELELPNAHMGQFFTPYDVSRMMAEMTLDTIGEIIAEQGFVTVQEPACGAGGMIIAAADVIERKGFDIGQQLYVDGTDISPTCFKMSYLQASLRGIPATIRRGNTLSLEIFEQAMTPAFFGFYATHQNRFDAWQRGESRGTIACDAVISSQEGAGAKINEPEPVKPGTSAASSRKRETKPPRQLNLFD